MNYCKLKSCIYIYGLQSVFQSTGVYIIIIIDIFAPPPSSKMIFFPPSTVKIFSLPSFFPPLTIYIRVLINNSSYFFPNQSKTHIFVK